MIIPLPVESAVVLEGRTSTARFQHESGDIVAAHGEHSTAALDRFLEPLLVELCRHVDEIAASELHRVRSGLADLSRGEREAIEALAVRLPRAILQRFVEGLRLAVRTDDRALIEAARFFLGTDAHPPAAPMPMWRSNGNKPLSRRGDR